MFTCTYTLQTLPLSTSLQYSNNLSKAAQNSNNENKLTRLITCYIHSLGLIQASNSFHSSVPSSGFYTHKTPLLNLQYPNELGLSVFLSQMRNELTWSYSHLADSGRETRILSILPPVFRPNVVPRSYTFSNQCQHTLDKYKVHHKIQGS